VTEQPLRPTLGLASRKAATAALEAHVEVLKGTAMRRAISEALFKAVKLGGKERRFVAYATRELSRHMRRLELSAKTRGWPSSKLHLPEDQALLRYALWRRELCGAPVEKIMTEVGLPGPIRPRGIPDQLIRGEIEKTVELDFGATPLDQAASRQSFPNWLAERIAEVAPAGELEAIFEALNREPFLTFRTRPEGTRDELIAALAEKGIEVEASPQTTDTVRVSNESRAIFESRWMKEGRLQVMDLGSQLLAGLCQVRPGMVAVDYCAGAGGKTIALADAVGPSGRVYAWDNSPKRLQEAKRRVQELKLRHVTFPTPVRIDLADVVLIDAPCSGTGTLSREPDQKWKLTWKKVEELAQTQLGILALVAPQVKPGGVIVYGTCSLLQAENEAVVDAFLARTKGWTRGEQLRVWPHRIDGGGFFGARLIKS
jgi:16S rRNA (cytosine967-C5)-methyltransferase